MRRHRRPVAVLLTAAGISFAALVMAGASGSSTELPGMVRHSDSVASHLKTFDDLDFDVFSNQKWDRLGESHADDIVVTWPDGHQTKGIAKHIEDLKAMFVYAPDTRIKVHPIKFGSGEWTCVTGVMTGTFSRPMPIPDGSTIAPTGKTFKMAMATIGQWKNGKMIAESLFWDNQEFMRQIGLVK